MKQLYKICVMINSFALLFSTSTNAQQEAMYTQYMFNGLAINPAYAGSHETLTMSALVRYQWSGLEGAPVTQTFSAHSPIARKKIALGFLMVHDKIGVTDQSTVKVAYAYRIPTNRKGSYFSLGIQGGMMYYQAMYSKVSTSDPAFTRDVTLLQPNVGVGIYYYTKRFYFGLSAPELLHQSITDKTGLLKVSHFYLTSGYVFNLNRVVKFKPNILFKAVNGAPLEMDLNANFLFNNVVWAGLSWRSFDSVDALFQINLSKQWQLGYAYDFLTSNAIRTVNTGTHELMISYRVQIRKKLPCPIYF